MGPSRELKVSVWTLLTFDDNFDENKLFVK